MSLLCRVHIILFGGELVGVPKLSLMSRDVGNSTSVRILPSQVNIERWDSNLSWILCQDREIPVVFLSDPLLSGGQSGGMNPIDRMHFLNECSLTNHGPDEIKGK